MNNKKAKLEQLQRYYALWKEGNAIYEEWAKLYGLSLNNVLVLYSLYESKGSCTQKSISHEWSIPKQTINTILKGLSANGYIKLSADTADKRSKLLKLTPKGKAYASEIIEALHKRELFVINRMGLNAITQMNDETELFIKLFRSGGLLENE